MLTTDKWTCRELVELMSAHGVKQAVISPGTRDTPLIMALVRSGKIATHSVIDERSAAFIALGMASVSGMPVALVCTSGTAMLNYAPAVAEAYYRHIPLIVVSADRPAEWIDQDDSQTIRQSSALANIVLASYNFNGSPAGDDERWMINRRINEALLCATGNCSGPVHINVAIGEPISGTEEIGQHNARVITRITGNEIPTALMREFGCEIASPLKVMVVVGFNPPDSRLNRSLRRLAQLPNFIVLAERTANLHSSDFIDVVDESLFMAMTDERLEELRPDILITTGGSLVSRPLKEQLRRWHPKHWYVGYNTGIVDCFMSVERIFDVAPVHFFMKLASAMQPHREPSGYASLWHSFYDSLKVRLNGFKAGWSDLAAVRYIASLLPAHCNLQVSNGMTLRYLLSAPKLSVHRLDCNRGVSGIDGSVSTAVGASLEYNGDTVLLTGDMSAQYDIAALASPLITSRFRMIVIANGDGGIFRVIRTTRKLPELDHYIASRVNFPARQLADGYGFAYYEASSMNELKNVLPVFIADSSHKAMLVVRTDSVESAAVASDYYRYLRTLK